MDAVPPDLVHGHEALADAGVPSSLCRSVIIQVLMGKSDRCTNLLDISDPVPDTPHGDIKKQDDPIQEDPMQS